MKNLILFLSLLLVSISIVLPLRANTASLVAQDPIQAVRLEMKTSNTNQYSNTLALSFQLSNSGSADIDLGNVAIRYYYTNEDSKDQNFYCDNAAIIGSKYKSITSKVSGAFYTIGDAADSADTYFEISFSKNSGELSSDEKVQVNVRIAKTDWSNYNQYNDYSFCIDGGNYQEWDKATVWNNSQLVWGVEHTASNTGDDDDDDDSVENNVSLAFNSVIKSEITNTLYANYKITNDGENEIDLNAITIRYYYTSEDDQKQYLHCDHAGISEEYAYNEVQKNKVSGSFYALDSVVPDADTYCEISFLPGAGSINQGESVIVDTRIRKSGWGEYNQFNDYSFFYEGNDFMEWDKVTVYIDGELVWGIEPVNTEIIGGDVPDSLELLALTEFFNATDGYNWKHSNNWLTDTIIAHVKNWYGLSVAEGDVSKISLSANNLSGFLPESLSNLSALKSFDVSNNAISNVGGAALVGLDNCTEYNLSFNQISELPNFASHRNIEDVALILDGNLLDFGDLESLFMSAGEPIVKELSYSNQAVLGESESLTFHQTKALTLNLNTPGNYNTYQWQRKVYQGNSGNNNGNGNGNNFSWESINGETGATYQVENCSPDDAGTYRCVVQNSWVTDLELVSGEFIVEIDDYFEVAFQIDFGSFKNSPLSYEVILPDDRDTIAFGRINEFVLANPEESETILLNVLQGGESIGKGFKFNVDISGDISDLLMVTGTDLIEINPQFYAVEDEKISFSSLQATPNNWHGIELTLENGLKLSPDGDGIYDVMEVVGVDSSSFGSLQIFSLDDELVYTMSDSILYWDGINIATNSLVAKGVYFYNLKLDAVELKGQLIVEY